MSEKIAEKFIIGLSENLPKNKFASLVSYFSITQGKGSTEIPNVNLFPNLDSKKDKARLLNRLKNELNFLGVSVKRFNQGTRVLEKIENIKNEEIHSDLMDYINNTNHRNKWAFLLDKDVFVLTFSLEDKGCFCRTTSNRDEDGHLLFKQDRHINIDLISLAKITQAIHKELNLPDIRLKETLETIIYSSILHEKGHLFQTKLDDAVEHLRKMKSQNAKRGINFSSVSNFTKFYLRFEYKAWENAFKKDEDSHRTRIINDALCNMSITSYITGWLSEVYFNNTFTLPHEDTTFKIDTKAPSCF